MSSEKHTAKEGKLNTILCTWPQNDKLLIIRFLSNGSFFFLVTFWTSHLFIYKGSWLIIGWTSWKSCLLELGRMDELDFRVECAQPSCRAMSTKSIYRQPALKLHHLSSFPANDSFRALSPAEDFHNMYLFKCSWSWPKRCSTSPYVISLAELSSSLSSWNCADSSMKSVGFLQAHLSQHRSGGAENNRRALQPHMWVTTTSSLNIKRKSLL